MYTALSSAKIIYCYLSIFVYLINYFLQLVGSDMTKSACEKLRSQCGLSPADAQVIELHDCFSANELVTYEALGLCPEGSKILKLKVKAKVFVRRSLRVYWLKRIFY